MVNRAYHLDAQGPVQAITYGGQATETRYLLDAWGSVLSRTASDNPYVYLGGLGYWRDSDSGICYGRARCEGEALAILVEITASDIDRWLGGMPEGNDHCPHLAARALSRAAPPTR
jgi:hypothetical protein